MAKKKNGGGGGGGNGGSGGGNDGGGGGGGSVQTGDGQCSNTHTSPMPEPALYKSDGRSTDPNAYCTDANALSSGRKKEGATFGTAVLKVDFHCDGCADKIRRSLKGFKGVEGVKMDRGANKVTVAGTMDPWKLRDQMQKKTKKNVEVLSPATKKQNTCHNKEKTQKCNKQEDNCDNSKKAERGGKENENSCQKKDKKKGDKQEENSKCEKQENACHPKEEGKKDDKQVVVVNTIVLKVMLHCIGCIRRIRGALMKIEGVEQVAIDVQKNQITVKGTMKTKGFVEFVAQKIQRHVEVVDPKKEKKDNKQEEKKEKEKTCFGQMTCHADVGWCHCDKCGYHVYTVPAPQLFSDENPNACSVM